MKGKLLVSECEFRNLFARKAVRKIKEFITEFLMFWEHHDELYGTCHNLLVKRLYLCESVNLTHVAHEMHIEDRTLYRYRKLYVKLLECLQKKYNIT